MNLAPLWKNFPTMIPELEKVRRVIGTCVDESPAGVRDELRRILSSPGKMLRPAFTIIASSWGTAFASDSVIQIAAAVELLHTASLIHDDVLDKAASRRGIQTIHRSIGVKKAVLAGDYLMTRAMALSAPAFSEEHLPLFLDSINSLCRSEIDQDFNCFNLKIEREVYLRRIRGKTAELFGIACLAGAVGGGASTEVCQQLYELGIAFGTAFQIEDDILDYTGGTGKTGKKTGKDIRAGIPTLPLIEALTARDPLITKLCTRPAVRLAPGLIRGLVVRRGYIDTAAAAAEKYRSQSMEIVGRLPDNRNSELFCNLIRKTAGSAIPTADRQ